MKINIKQDATYERDNWWKWSIWVDGDKDDLAKIESVEYTLHPTFSPPVVRVTDRNSKFRLDSSGWGEFLIHALVTTKDGRAKKLSHWLELIMPAEGTDQAQQNAPARGMSSESVSPVLFLSCNIADMPFANALRKVLLAQGTEILMVEDQPTGLPWEASLNLLLNRADLALFLISDTPNTWMKREHTAIKERKIPVIPVLIMNGKVSLTDLPDDMKDAIRIKPVLPEESEKASQHLVKRIDSEFKSIIAKTGKKKKARSS